MTGLAGMGLELATATTPSFSGPSNGRRSTRRSQGRVERSAAMGARCGHERGDKQRHRGWRRQGLRCQHTSEAGVSCSRVTSGFRRAEE